jgi:hypothetical protein
MEIKLEIDYDKLADEVASRVVAGMAAKENEGRKLTINEAARYCSCNPATIRNYLAKGLIHNYGSAGKHLFLEKELKTFKRK